MALTLPFQRETAWNGMNDAETTQCEDFGLLISLHFPAPQSEKHTLLRHSSLTEHGFKTSIWQFQGQLGKLFSL